MNEYFLLIVSEQEFHYYSCDSGGEVRKWVLIFSQDGNFKKFKLILDDHSAYEISQIQDIIPITEQEFEDECKTPIKGLVDTIVGEHPTPPPPRG